MQGLMDACQILSSFREHSGEKEKRMRQEPKTVSGGCGIAVARRVGIFGPTATRHRNDHIPLHCVHVPPSI